MRRARAFALGVFLVLSLGAGVAGAVQNVAVLPFYDLSGGKGSIGEAIRETVTADLKDVPGLKVVERGNIDKVLAEQNMQSQRTDLGPAATMSIGKLLGATLMVAGAYQRSGSTVRITARFVRVETGEIIGTAKVDGPSTDFLYLQDKVTAQLLGSAGIEAAQVQRFAKRSRPKLKSIRVIELYGDAAVETDDQRKSEILKEALVEDPGFSYALNDLDALQKRMKGYVARASVEQDKALRELREAARKEKDPIARASAQMQLIGQLSSQRRYHQVQREARAILAESAGQTTPPKRNALNLPELAGMWLVDADASLKQHDAVLRDGEAFMRRFPASQYHANVVAQMEMVIKAKKDEAAGRLKIDKELAQMRSAWKWDPCLVGVRYRGVSLHQEARRLYLACLELGTDDRKKTLDVLLDLDVEVGDFKALKKHIEMLEAIEPDNVSARNARYRLPADE